VYTQIRPREGQIARMSPLFHVVPYQVLTGTRTGTSLVVSLPFGKFFDSDEPGATRQVLLSLRVL
jgi:hypothetical protein